MVKKSVLKQKYQQNFLEIFLYNFCFSEFSKFLVIYIFSGQILWSYS